MSKRQAFLERRLLTADAGPVVTSTIFALKNAAADDWREKQEIDQKTTVEASDPLMSLLSTIAENGKKITDR